MAQPKQPADGKNTAMGSDVHRFIRRNSRYNIETPVVFHLPEGNVKGHSINISESGSFAAFEREIVPWLTGRLSAQFGDWHIDFSLRVARIEEHKAGLVFQGLSDKDHAILRRFLDHSNGEVS
jgi:hypothetical protein